MVSAQLLEEYVGAMVMEQFILQLKTMVNLAQQAAHLTRLDLLLRTRVIVYGTRQTSGQIRPVLLLCSQLTEEIFRYGRVLQGVQSQIKLYAQILQPMRLVRFFHSM